MNRLTEAKHERENVQRLVREVGELEAREAGLLQDFGPGAMETLG